MLYEGDRSFVEEFFKPDMHHLAMRLPIVILSFVVVRAIIRLALVNREVKVLKSLIPICAWCKKKIRNEAGDWQDVDRCLSDHGKDVSHSMCPDCYEKAGGKK